MSLVEAEAEVGEILLLRLDGQDQLERLQVEVVEGGVVVAVVAVGRSVYQDLPAVAESLDQDLFHGFPENFLANVHSMTPRLTSALLRILRFHSM